VRRRRRGAHRRPALADRIALLRNHGARPKYHHVAVGGNFRLDALQAAILGAKLPHLPAWTAARRALAARYRAALAGLAEVRMPADDPRHVYHHFVVRADARDRLRAHLAAAGIGTEIYYPSPLHLQPALADLGYRAGACPAAEAACAELVALPLYPSLPLDAVDRVAARCAAATADAPRPASPTRPPPAPAAAPPARGPRSPIGAT
jgi:dTDP-4-amino-4,6-dideoxygalactose transaminase